MHTYFVVFLSDIELGQTFPWICPYDLYAAYSNIEQSQWYKKNISPFFQIIRFLE